MALKFEIINNALVVTDTVTSAIVFDRPTKDTYYQSLRLDEGKVVLYDISGVNSYASETLNKPLEYAVDSALTPFTSETFRAFARENLGKSSPQTGGLKQYLQASELSDVTFAQSGVNYKINITNVDENNGVSLINSVINFTETGVYNIFAQPQINYTGAGGNKRFDMFFQLHDGNSWVDVSNSNAYISTDRNEGIVLPVNITTNITDTSHRIRVMGRVSNTGLKLEHNNTIPVTPSIILSVFK
jgi:hypothetical protein